MRLAMSASVLSMPAMWEMDIQEFTEVTNSQHCLAILSRTKQLIPPHLFYVTNCRSVIRMQKNVFVD